MFNPMHIDAQELVHSKYSTLDLENDVWDIKSYKMKNIPTNESKKNHKI